jgi:uncharacterized membrane protein
MATFTAWKFDTPEGADQAEQTLISLSKDELIEIHDAATVGWPAGARKPKTRQVSGIPAPVRSAVPSGG